MQFRIGCAVGATVLSVAALAAAPAAQAAPAPAVCSTPGFRALDAAVTRNPAGFARLLSFTYRFAPRPSAAAYDVLVRCDLSAATSVFTAFKAANAPEASSFQADFSRWYPNDPKSEFGSGGPVLNIT
jgi:hypothetical protein